MAILLANMTMGYSGLALFGEFQQITLSNVNTSVDTIPTPTTVGGVRVSALVEYQSTQGAILFPRLTNAQLASMVTPIAAMMDYNSTTGAFWQYQTPQATAAAVSAAGGWNPLGLSCASGTLTTAQIAAMYATPCRLLPAPPAGYAYLINSFTLNAVNAVAAWSQAGGPGNVGIQYGSAANGAGPLASAAMSTTMFTTAGFAHRIATAAGILVNDLSANYFDGTNAHAGIYLSNDTAALTTGGGVVGTAKWYITYMVVAIS